MVQSIIINWQSNAKIENLRRNLPKEDAIGAHSSQTRYLHWYCGTYKVTEVDLTKKLDTVYLQGNHIHTWLLQDL